MAAVTPVRGRTAAVAWLDVRVAAAMPVDGVLQDLPSAPEGLSAEEAARRLAASGPNAVRSHQARLLPVLLRQLRSPLLVLLGITATASFFVGQRSDALIIGVILAASVGLGLVNEYRAEGRGSAALTDQPSLYGCPRRSSGLGRRDRA